MDIKVFALITAVTTAVVGGVKKAFPVWTSGKEELLAVVLPVTFTIIAKISGLFHETSWVDALLVAVGSGVGSGLAHDYLVDPVIHGKDGEKDAKPE